MNWFDGTLVILNILTTLMWLYLMLNMNDKWAVILKAQRDEWIDFCNHIIEEKFE